MSELHAQPKVFRRKLRGVTWIPVLLLLALGAGWIFLMSQLRPVAMQADRRSRVISAIHQTSSLVAEMESGLRGYLLSGKESFLGGYQSGLNEVDATIDELDQSLAAVLSPAPEVFRLREEMKIWKSYAKEIIEKRDYRSEIEGDGKKRTDSMHRLLSQLLQRELIYRDEAEQKAAEYARLARILAFGSALLIGVLIAMFARRAVKAVVRPYEEELETLRESEARHRGTVEGLPTIGLATLDAHGIIQSWNTGATHLFGHSTAALVGKPWSTVFSPEDAQANRSSQILAEAAKGDMQRSEHWQMRADGSSFWGVSFVAPRKDPEGKVTGYTLLTYDATPRMKREPDRMKVVKRLREAVRVRDELLAASSQELRGSLTKLRAEIQDMLIGRNGLVQLPPVPKYIETLKSYRSHVDQMLSFVDEVLEPRPAGQPAQAPEANQ